VFVGLGSVEVERRAEGHHGSHPVGMLGCPAQGEDAPHRVPGDDHRLVLQLEGGQRIVEGREVRRRVGRSGGGHRPAEAEQVGDDDGAVPGEGVIGAPKLFPAATMPCSRSTTGSPEPRTRTRSGPAGRSTPRPGAHAATAAECWWRQLHHPAQPLAPRAAEHKTAPRWDNARRSCLWPRSAPGRHRHLRSLDKATRTTGDPTMSLSSPDHRAARYAARGRVSDHSPSE
jgi:hypothetical protein